VLSAEETYQRLQADADGTQQDVRLAEASLATAQSSLQQRRAELGRVQAELQVVDQALESARTAGLAARRSIEFWRGGLDASGAASPFRQQRLEDFRLRWSIPRDVWNQLLDDLGLTWLRLDAGLQGAVLPAEPQAAGVPPPGTTEDSARSAP